MKNKWPSRNFRFYSLLALIALSVVQFLHTSQSLQRYQEYTDQDYETLDKRMLRDNVSSDIKEHIIYVHKQSAFNTGLLIDSLSFSQIFIQFGILLVLFIFHSTDKRKTEERLDE